MWHGGASKQLREEYPATRNRNSALTTSSLFTGIGGFEIGFSQAGIATDFMVEIDPDARAVLRARFPNVALHGDVAAVDDLPASTRILTAGFPCQNLSMAGDKAGIAGNKSGVVTKLFGLITRSQVPTVVIENVYFMLQLDSGQAMHWLVERFEGLGYYWAYRVLNTIGFGLPQRRRRVYFVASREIDPRKVLFADESPLPKQTPVDLSQPIGFYWTEGRSGVGFTSDGIPPLKVGSAIGIASAPAVLFPDGEVLMPSLEACERLQGFPVGWTEVQNYAPVRKGARWRMVGNAVSVPVAKWIGDRMKGESPILDFAVSPMRERGRWPDAAWNVGNGRFAVKASDRPLGVLHCSINKFRDDSWTRLSDRALGGFISRAEAGGLSLPAGFLDALRLAARRPGKIRAQHAVRVQTPA